jgi:hypothetical protein
MHQLRHRDLDHRDLEHHLVRDLVYLQLLQYLDRLNDMGHLMLVHLFQCVVEIVNPMRRHHRQDVETMDVLQIQDEQNLDEVLTFQDAVLHFLVNLVGVQVDAEPHHQLKMDCYQDVVGVEPHHLLHL